MEALVGEACHQFREHIRRGCIPAAVEVLASNQEQGLGDMAFPGAGVSDNHNSLLTPHEVELGDLQHLGFVYPGLEREVKVREKLSLRKAGLFDSSLNPSFDSGGRFDPKEPFHKFGRWQCLLGGTGKFLIKDFQYSQKLQGLQMLPDFG